MVKSIDKGRNFEREIAKKFSLFWDGTERSVVRVPLSGGFPVFQSWGYLICQSSVFFPFMVSIKKVEKWSLDSIVSNDKNSPIIVWLKEIQSIFRKYLFGQRYFGSRYVLLPILVISKNRFPTLVVMDINDLDRLTPHIIRSVISDNVKVIKMYHLRICKLDDFLDITKSYLSRDKLLYDNILLEVYSQLYQVGSNSIKELVDLELKKEVKDGSRT